MACTAAKPISRAAAENRGHRATACPCGDVGDDDRLPGAVAVQARALVVLDLEQFRDPCLLGRGGHQLQHAAGVGQQQPRRVHLQQLHAPLGEHVQELHQVKAADQGVGQIDERLREALVHDRCHAARVAPCATRRYRRNMAVTVTGSEDQASVLGAGIKAQPAAHHVARDVAEGGAAGERVRPQPGERLLQAHAQLHRDHPGRLVHHGPAVRQPVQRPVTRRAR